jgi:hypothetical protein
VNRYWNLTEQERSKLTGEEVRAFMDVELMERGVKKIAPPTVARNTFGDFVIT